MTDEEKIKFSQEHLFYEIDMFFNTIKLLEGPRDKLLTNILVESFVVHLRNNIDFLYSYSENKRPDDVTVSDFIDGSDLSWLPSYSETLRNAHTRANKEMSHLTTKRIAGTPPEKSWPVSEIRKEVLDLLVMFSAKASKDMLDQRVIDRINQEQLR